MIQIKRAYDPPAKTNGLRILVERLWPRGIKKEALKLNAWLKDAAPAPNCGSGSATTRPSGPSFSVVTGPNLASILTRGSQSLTQRRKHGDAAVQFARRRTQ